MKVPIASITALNDRGINKNFDMVLNPTIDTASLITDSPYLNLISFQYSYTSIDNIGSTDNVPKRARVHTGSVADISIEKMEHSITEKSIPGKK